MDLLFLIKQVLSKKERVQSEQGIRIDRKGREPSGRGIRSANERKPVTVKEKALIIISDTEEPYSRVKALITYEFTERHVIRAEQWMKGLIERNMGELSGYSYSISNAMPVRCFPCACSVLSYI